MVQKKSGNQSSHHSDRSCLGRVGDRVGPTNYQQINGVTGRSLLIAYTHRNAVQGQSSDYLQQIIKPALAITGLFFIFLIYFRNDFYYHSKSLKVLPIFYLTLHCTLLQMSKSHRFADY